MFMKKVLAIVGSTASGKTKLSIKVAKALNAEIISADSRQVYKHIPVASAIPTVKERQGVVHHFFEEYNLNEIHVEEAVSRQGPDVIETRVWWDK